MGKCKHFFAVALITLSSMGVSALPLQLPADEEGLAELLEARAIDTLQYEQLLAFYALPLSVPQGELLYLAQVFPDIAEIIPASLEELSVYKPFDNRQILRFFNDYPDLAGFEPVLRFNAAVSPNSEVVVGINRSSIEALKGHRIRFRHKGGLLSAEGVMAFSDSAALWQNRCLGLSYRGVNARIGNFKRPIPGELAFGRFGRLSSLMELTESKTDDVAANWLYGGSGAWNGVSVEVKEIWGARSVGIGSSAFCHLRPAEAGGGAGVNMSAWKRAKVFAGITGFRLGSESGGPVDGSGAYADDGADDAGERGVVANYYYYAHLYAEYNAKSVRAAAETAVPLVRESLTAAVTLRLNYRVKGSSAEYRAIFYPAGGAFPMSRLKKQLSTEAGESEPAPIQKHAVKMAVPFISDAVKLIPELDFVESGGVKKIYGQAEARARAGVADIAVKHSAKIFTTGADSALYSSYASVNCQTPYPVEVRAVYQRTYGYYKNARNTYALEAPATVIPNTVIAPYVRGKYVTYSEYWLGVKCEFHLYQKTWTGITLETPVNVKGADNVYVKVSSSYSF